VEIFLTFGIGEVPSDGMAQQSRLSNNRSVEQFAIPLSYGIFIVTYCQ
jgi:hypothetical protein